MSTDTQLAIRTEARIRDAERNLAKFEKSAARHMANVEGRNRKFGNRVEKDLAGVGTRMQGMFLNVGKGMAAGLVAGGVAGIVGGIATAVRNATSAIADLKAQAETAGVSFQAFQELKFSAEQSKVSIDALTDGLKEMQLRADEFIDTGKGSGAEAFAQLGFRAGDLATRLKEPDQLFEEIIDRLSQLDKASQIRISDEIFGGTGGEQFVRFLEDGRRGIETMRDRFHEVGKAISDDAAAKAEALDQRFNEIATTLSTTMKSATVTFADAAVSAFDRATAAADRYQRSLNAVSGGAAMGELAGGPMARLQRDLDAQRRGEYVGAEGFSRSDLDMSTDKTGRIEPKRHRTFTPYKLPPGGGGGGGGSSAVSDAERQEEATRKVIEALQDEVMMLGMTEEAQHVLTEAKRAGVVEGSKEYAQIEQLVAAYHDKSAAMERTAEMQRFANDMAMDGVRDLTYAIDTGNQALDRMLATLIETVAQAALLGEGPLAGLFGRGGGINFGGGSDPWSGMRQVGGGGGGLGGFISGGIGLIGGLLGFADGGNVRGPGTGTSDSIPAMLSDGEFVVRSAMAKRHRPLLEQINAGMMPRHFAQGGSVFSGGQQMQAFLPGDGGMLPTTVPALKPASLPAPPSAAPVKVDVEVFVKDDGTFGAIARAAGSQAAKVQVKQYDRYRRKRHEATNGFV